MTYCKYHAHMVIQVQILSFSLLSYTRVVVPSPLRGGACVLSGYTLEHLSKVGVSKQNGSHIRIVECLRI